jgi:hypothetical protein
VLIEELQVEDGWSVRDHQDRSSCRDFVARFSCFSEMNDIIYKIIKNLSSPTIKTLTFLSLADNPPV